MSTLPNPNTPQLKVIDTYFKSLATYNFTVLKTLTTDDFRMSTAPASIGVPTKTKDEDLAVLEKVKEGLKGEELKFTFYDVVDGLGKTWVHGKIESLDIEFVYLITFGTGLNALKFVQLVDFSDSKRYLEIDPESGNPKWGNDGCVESAHQPEDV